VKQGFTLSAVLRSGFDPAIRSASLYKYPSRLRAESARFCRDPRFRLSQIIWRTSVAHHPTVDTWDAMR
jgi:hypothetical protein